MVVWIIVAVLLLICGARGGSSGRRADSLLSAYFFWPSRGKWWRCGLLHRVEDRGSSRVSIADRQLLAGPILVLDHPGGLGKSLPRCARPFPSLRANSSAPITLLAAISADPFSISSVSHLARKTATAEVNAALVNQENQERTEGAKSSGHAGYARQDRCSADRWPITFGDRITAPRRNPPFATQRGPKPALSQIVRPMPRNCFPSITSLLCARSPISTLPPLPLCVRAPGKYSCQRQPSSPLTVTPYISRDAEREVAPYIESMRWLLAHGCDCKAEIAGVEQAVGRFANSKRREKLLADLAAAKADK